MLVTGHSKTGELPYPWFLVVLACKLPHQRVKALGKLKSIKLLFIAQARILYGKNLQAYENRN